jgi:hypothetical protein
MNFTATNVLKDCKEACWELLLAEEKNDSQVIKLRWFTCLALLRSVGHVIDKVDRINYNQYQKIFNEHYKEKKEDSIFKDFIDNERNLILKQYIDYIQNEENIVLEKPNLVDENGNCIVDEEGNRILLSPAEVVTKYFIKSDGFASGKLLHEIVELGIIWWEDYINNLKIKCIGKIT